MKTLLNGSPRALVCAPLPPEHDKESGSRRIYHMIELLRSEGWHVTFVCENAPADSPHVRHLRQAGVPTYVGFDEPTSHMIEAGGFDLALFAFWYMAKRYGDRVRRLSPGTRIVVETVDLHWLRKARRKLGGLGGPGEGPGLLDDEYGAEMVSELNTYAAADGVLTVSRKEAGLVNDLAGDPELAHQVPDFDEIEPGATPLEDRRGILFIGNFRHPPNLDAVRYLCGEILPLVSTEVLMRHPVSVVGNAPDGRVRAAVESCDGAELVGWVPSVVPYLQEARASVVPLRYGAGTKRKLIQALLAATPSVSTAAGVEGIDVEHGEHLLVADDAPSFAAALERILEDGELAARLAARGREKMVARHGRSVSRERLAEAMGSVLARPPRRPPTEAGGEAAEAARRFTAAVEDEVPDGAVVLVVSKGDPGLVDLPRHDAHHFPASEGGGYAGFHPRDSIQAIQHLDEFVGTAGYLVFPAASAWWLEHYAAFASHLESHHERVCDRDACVVYRLRSRRTDTRAAEVVRTRMAGPRTGTASGIVSRPGEPPLSTGERRPARRTTRLEGGPA